MRIRSSLSQGQPRVGNWLVRPDPHLIGRIVVRLFPPQTQLTVGLVISRAARTTSHQPASRQDQQAAHRSHWVGQVKLSNRP